jgi:plastocyanin
MGSDLDVSVGRSQLGLGVVAGVVAYVIGFLISVLPGPIANPRAYPPGDVVNGTINESELPPTAVQPGPEPQFPLTETIDPFNSAAGVFYNAHFVDILVGLRQQPSLSQGRNVLLDAVTNDTVTISVFGSGETELLLIGAPVPPIVFFLVPVVLLALGGALVNELAGETAPTPETAVASGSSVALGYLPPVAIIASIVRFREPRIVFGGIDFLGAILIAGVVYPVVFGGLGGYVWSVVRGGRAGDEGASTSEPGDAPRRSREGTPGDPGGDGTSTGATAVAMTDGLAFEPETVTIDPGSAVRWENGTNLTFTVTAYEETVPRGVEYFASGGFDTEAAAREAYPEGGIASGESYEHVFETPGTYEYFCVPQEDAGMTGTVEVREK